MNDDLQPNPDAAWMVEDLVARCLELEDTGRDELLADAPGEVAREARDQLAMLDALGLSIDGAPRRRWSVGPYELLERVGGGGMGEVQRARDQRDGRIVAVKLLRRDQVFFEGAHRRFEREIAAASCLDHEGVARLFEVGDEDGMPWLAMEWIPGASLDRILARLRGRSAGSLRAEDFGRAVHALSPEASAGPGFEGEDYRSVVAALVAKVADALQHAHEAGVLHRDVKPSNVLVTPAGRVVLVDFGLALPSGAERMTRTGSWLGSLPYASPEQLEGSPSELDARTDVYSLGVTLYELLTLEPPFLEASESRTKRRILAGEYESVSRLDPAVPRSLELVCERAMDVDREWRYSSAAEFAEDLRAAASGRSVRARPLPVHVRLHRLARRRPRIAAASTALALVIVSLLAFAMRERTYRTRVTRLADSELLTRLLDEAASFWPSYAEDVPRMERWLVDARDVLERETEHRRALEELRSRALPYTDEERESDRATSVEALLALKLEVLGLQEFVAGGDPRAKRAPVDRSRVRAAWEATREELADRPDEAARDLATELAAVRAKMEASPDLWGPELGQLDDFDRTLAEAVPGLTRRATYAFVDPVDRWRHEELSRLTERLTALADLVDDVGRKLLETHRLERALVEEDARAWEAACASVARSPVYGGLELDPIFGLEPLGPNDAGLWEFVALATGTTPDGEVGEETGIVLVLLPGGAFEMGDRPEDGRYDDVPATEPREPHGAPRHVVDLDPFFMSKYELTVAQARRIGGLPEERVYAGDPRLPVAISWTDARALLHRVGMDLPTEAQWEYAARANAPSPSTLEGRANVADRDWSVAVERRWGTSDIGIAPFRDGFALEAPVGSFRPNDFGLHDMIGNLAEWCLDWHVTRGYSSMPSRPVDGLKDSVLDGRQRVVRGGAYLTKPLDAHVGRSARGRDPDQFLHWVGVRPVRSIELSR